MVYVIRRIRHVRLGEISRQLSWTQEPVRLSHYRDRDGYEVDGHLERAFGEIVAIEVKRPRRSVGITSAVSIGWLSGWGDQLTAGILLYTGVHSFSELYVSVDVTPPDLMRRRRRLYG